MSKIYSYTFTILDPMSKNSTNNKTRNPFYSFSYYKAKYALTIQRYYKGYKIRKILNNIYKKLPCDIQKIIISHIREKYYYKKYINTIGNIVEKKIVSKINLIEYILHKNYSTDIAKMRDIFIYFCNNSKNIYKTMKLYKKYYYTLQNKHQLKYRNIAFIFMKNIIVIIYLLVKIAVSQSCEIY